MNKYLTVFVAFFTLILLSACGSDVKEAPAKEVKRKNRIASILVSSYNSQQLFNFKYNSNGSVDVDVAATGASFGIHLDYNDERKVTEMISGAGRIQNIYGPQGRRVGSVVISDNSQVEFKYDDKGNLIQQINFAMGDTIAKYSYKFEGGEDPTTVVFSDKDGNKRVYALKFDSEENMVRNKFEMLYPQEDIYWLGIPALYGKHNLLEATLMSKSEGENAEVNLATYSPGSIKYRFINNDDGSKLIKSISDGTKEWTAKIEYE